MSNFFNPAPRGNFSMFSQEHILFMLIEFMVVAALCYWLHALPKEKIKKLLACTALVVLCFDPAYWLWEYRFFGAFRWETTLPLYFCSLFWLLMPIAAFSKKQGFMWRSALSCICTLCLVAGVFGTVFNVHLNAYPFWSFVPLRSLLYHFFMIAVPAVLWTSRYYQPQPRDLILFFVPVAVLFLPCAVLDGLFGWDYCYLNGGIGTPLELISRGLPRPVFALILYVFLYLVVGAIFYIPTVHKMMWGKRESRKLLVE